MQIMNGFDFNAAAGVRKAQIQGLAGLAFIERSENVVLLVYSQPIPSTPKPATIITI